MYLKYLISSSTESSEFCFYYGETYHNRFESLIREKAFTLKQWFMVLVQKLNTTVRKKTSEQLIRNFKISDAEIFLEYIYLVLNVNKLK